MWDLNPLLPMRNFDKDMESTCLRKQLGSGWQMRDFGRSKDVEKTGFIKEESAEVDLVNFFKEMGLVTHGLKIEDQNAQ